MKIFIFLFFIMNNIYSEEITSFYVESYPPDINCAHNYMFRLKENNVLEREVLNVYYTQDLSNHDTLIKSIYRYVDTLNTYQFINEYHKDIKSNTFFVLNKDEIKNELLIEKQTNKKKKTIQASSNQVVSYHIDQNLQINYRLEYPIEMDSLVYERLDINGNIVNITFYNNHYRDTVSIVYSYDYNNKSGKSIEYFQGKKYLRSIISLNTNNQVFKESFYMLDYLKTDYKEMQQAIPFRVCLYEFYENKLLKEITLITKYSTITYLHNYTFNKN